MDPRDATIPYVTSRAKHVVVRPRRIYVRARTNPQSAHVWWPARQLCYAPIAQLAAHCAPTPAGTDRRTDRLRRRGGGAVVGRRFNVRSDLSSCCRLVLQRARAQLYTTLNVHISSADRIVIRHTQTRLLLCSTLNQLSTSLCKPRHCLHFIIIIIMFYYGIMAARHIFWGGVLPQTPWLN